MRTCEWLDGPRGAYVKCGRPVGRGSYCAEHGDRCYVGEKKSAEKPRDET